MSAIQTSPSVSATSFSSRSERPVIPLLSLAQPALALGEALALGGDPGDERHVGDIWYVITRAADLVKDGDRLENLAWRHWGQPRRDRRASFSSNGTASSSSLPTPNHELSHLSFDRPRSSERRSFGGALKLLLEEDNFKDWVEDAKRKVIVPILSVPDTPVADVEIRLVEPTPVPSRVGSLGGSLATSGLLAATSVPPKLNEEEELYEEGENFDDDGPVASSSKVEIRSRSRSPRKKGKFFVHSSPSKGSGSDSPHASPVPPVEETVHIPPMPLPRRQSSGSSSGGVIMKSKKEKEKRHVSLSTMRGKYAAEKRKVAEAIAKENDEGSGWEDEVEEGQGCEDEGWSDEPEALEKPKRPKGRSSSRSRSGRSSSNLDLSHRLTRQTSRRTPPKDVPPPPAPTPLRKMSKKERQAAAAERAKIEAELDAQKKREMFAKKQIFGGRAAGEGLLSQVLKSGGSMVDLLQAPKTRSGLRPSPTHGDLPSLGRSPTPGPSLLRSKSAVAMPIQSGVSVTVSPHSRDPGLLHASKRRPSKEGLDKRAPTAVVLESSDEDTDDDYLATSQTRRKIAELAAKREAKPQPVPAGYRLDDNGVVQAVSPTSRRRAIIMREMSESLRHNLILERQKSSGGTSRHNSVGQQPSRPAPSTHTSVLPAREAALNQAQHAPGAPLARHRSQPIIHHPAPTADPDPTPPQQTQHPPEPSRRRTQANVLGGGFLRPLTRVGEPSLLGRTQSTAALQLVFANEPPSPSPLGAPEAPAMIRRSTDGDGRASSHELRRRELARRSETMDTSYRSHGW